MSVSVIIPTYNRSALVQKTIDSVLNQTYTNYKIIVIDDGSTDDTEQQLVKYKNKIQYIKQENRGLNSARNLGLEIAKGKYIALLDSDDLWLDFKLELEALILDEHQDCGFVFSDFFILKSEDKCIPNGLHTWFSEKPDWANIYQSSAKYACNIESDELHQSSIDLHFGDIYHISLFGPRVLPSASLFRRSMTDGFIKFNESDIACGDWEFFAKLSHKHNPVFLDLETALNRSHEDAVRLTRIDPKIQLSQRIAMIERTWKDDKEFYSAHGEEIDNELTKVYLQLLKFQLVAGLNDQARKSIREINRIGSKIKSNRLQLYKVATYLPGGSFLLKMMRKLNQAIN